MTVSERAGPVNLRASVGHASPWPSREGLSSIMPAQYGRARCRPLLNEPIAAFVFSSLAPLGANGVRGGRMYTRIVNGADVRLLKKLATTRKILLYLSEKFVLGAEFYFDMGAFRHAFATGGPGKVARVKRGLEMKQVRRALYQLRRKKMLAWRRRGDAMICSMTRTGMLEGLREQIRFASAYSDDRVCVVTFDVPEWERLSRQFLRNFLRDCGFRMRQRSVWVSNKAVHALVARVIREIPAGRWVHVYEARQCRIGDRGDSCLRQQTRQ